MGQCPAAENPSCAVETQSTDAEGSVKKQKAAHHWLCNVEVGSNELSPVGDALENVFVAECCYNGAPFDPTGFVMHTEAADQVPQNRSEMLRLPPEQRDAFIEAELRELNRIAEMGVVEGVVPIPKGIKPINSRMVYDWKDPVSQEGAHQFGEGEAPERLAKCRLTMKDMKNVPNYLSNVVREVFAPTGQGVTFRLLIVLMLLLGLICDHIDVSTAFLYATLDHPIFMNPPSGYPCKEGHCLKIVRALYGCRAAPREWFKLLRDFILSLGFLESALDQCLFHRGAGPTLFLIFIYVDDILLFCADANLRKEVKDRFFIRFRCKDLGEVKRFLGVWIEVAKDRSSALLHQRQYCHKIVETFRPFWDIFKSVRKYPLPVDIQEEIHVEGPEMTPDHPQFE
jgi:hypothetical protein